MGMFSNRKEELIGEILESITNNTKEVIVILEELIKQNLAQQKSINILEERIKKLENSKFYKN